MQNLLAIADPARRRIVELLAARERTAGELVKEFERSAPAISQHLNGLREAGPITTRAEGHSRIQVLNPDRFDDLEAWLKKTRSVWSRRLDGLERELRGGRGKRKLSEKNFLMKNNEQHGKFTGPGEVRLVRTLPGPIERVWQYLTDPEKRARWFAGGMLEQKPGGRVELAMRQANIAPDENPPDKYKHMHDSGVTFEGRVLRCEPPRLLVFTFGGDDSEVTFELKTEGSQVLLVLTHLAKGEDRPDLGNFATGWHTHLAQLVALLEGTPRPPFWAMHAKLLVDYEKL